MVYLAMALINLAARSSGVVRSMREVPGSIPGAALVVLCIHTPCLSSRAAAYQSHECLPVSAYNDYFLRAWFAGARPSLPTKSSGFGGFDPSRFLILRGGNSHVRGIYRESPGKFDSRVLSREILSRWTGRTLCGSMVR